MCKCENPCGRKPSVETSNVISREKSKHSLQVHLPGRKQFAEEREELVCEGPWLEFESLVLNQVISQAFANNEQDISAITMLYNDIVYYSTCSVNIHPLPYNIVSLKKCIIEKGHLP